MTDSGFRQRLRVLRAVQDYAIITAGALIAAAGVDLFLTPNKVVSAGVTGIAMLTHFAWKWPVGLVTLGLNLPLFLLAIRWGGGFKLLIKTLYATVVMSLGIDLLQPLLPAVQGDPLIYTLFGGLVDGLGIGLVLRAGGTTGGTDILAQLFYRYRRVSFGTVFLVSNTVILLGAIPVVGLVPVLYALIVNYISSRVLDTVQEGLGYARAVTIVSEKPEEVRQAILEQIGRGLTVLQGWGGFSKEPRPVLYVVVSRSQISALKRLIADRDPDAFVVVSEAHEVLGEGFRPVSD